jgi:phi13 family phage major tail protein
MANKVLFGISNLHVGTYTEEGGTVTLGTPYHQKGAVSLSPTESAEKTDFYADNILYYSSFAGGTFEGELEVALFDDDFKTQFLGYVTLTNGGLAITKNATKPKVYIAFEVEGDTEKRRAIFYNCEFGAISREYSTIEETKEPQTATINFTCAGDNATGVTMATFKPADTGYSTLFTNPTAPAL